MKKLNIQKDLDSRREIARAAFFPLRENAVKKITEPTKGNDDKSEEQERQAAYVSPKGRGKKRKLQDGRPRGTYKKYPFEQTRLGFLLKYEMPVVYRLLMLRYKDVPFPQPSPDVIRVICRGSRDKTCKKGKFKRAFEEYARNGICCRRPKLLTEKRKSYYDSIRKKKMQAFIRENREKIEQMRKQTFKNNIKKTP